MRLMSNLPNSGVDPATVAAFNGCRLVSSKCRLINVTAHSESITCSNKEHTPRNYFVSNKSSEGISDISKLRILFSKRCTLQISHHHPVTRFTAVSLLLKTPDIRFNAVPQLLHIVAVAKSKRQYLRR